MVDTEANGRLRAIEASIAEVAGELKATRVEVSAINKRLNDWEQPGRGQVCMFEKQRLDKLEATVGKQSLIGGTLGAIAAGIVLAIKAIFDR